MGTIVPISSDMTNVARIEVSAATEATDELAQAFARLVPQLSSAAPPDRKALAEIIAAPCNTLLLARDRSRGGQIVGTLTLVIFPVPTALRAWIEDVVVDESARGRGVGETLVREALRIAQARGARTIDLTSGPRRQAARRLYERLGFAVRDTNAYRYVSPGADDTGPIPAADGASGP